MVDDTNREEDLVNRIRDYRKIWLRELGSSSDKMFQYLNSEFRKSSGESFRLAILDCADAIDLMAEEAEEERKREMERQKESFPGPIDNALAPKKKRCLPEYNEICNDGRPEDR